jgi:hypothetical protein
MTNVQPPPTDTNNPPQVDLADPKARAQWLALMRTQTDDAIEAGLDATSRPRRRVLGRWEARRHIKAAKRAIKSLLAAADAALTPAPGDEHGDPSGTSDAGPAP